VGLVGVGRGDSRTDSRVKIRDSREKGTEIAEPISVARMRSVIRFYDAGPRTDVTQFFISQNLLRQVLSH
jgi:hypothetical protein